MQGVGRTEVVLGWGVARVTVALVHLLFLFERLSKLFDLFADGIHDVVSGHFFFRCLHLLNDGFEFVNHGIRFVCFLGRKSVFATLHGS